MNQPTRSDQERIYLSLAGAERYTTLSVGTLRRLLREKKLRGYRPSGRRVLLDRDELDALIRASADERVPAAALVEDVKTGNGIIPSHLPETECEKARLEDVGAAK